MSKSCQINSVQARGGPNYEYAISNTARLAGHVASCDSAELLRKHSSEHHYDADIHPVSFAKLAGAFSYQLEPCTQRRSHRRAVGEGMARGEHSPTRLIDCASSSFYQSARCNTGLRKESSVGNGNHCAWVFKREARDRRCEFRQTNHSLIPSQGVVCVRSIPPAR